MKKIMMFTILALIFGPVSYSLAVDQNVPVAIEETIADPVPQAEPIINDIELIPELCDFSLPSIPLSCVTNFDITDQEKFGSEEASKVDDEIIEEETPPSSIPVCPQIPNLPIIPNQILPCALVIASNENEGSNDIGPVENDIELPAEDPIIPPTITICPNGSALNPVQLGPNLVVPCVTIQGSHDDEPDVIGPVDDDPIIPEHDPAIDDEEEEEENVTPPSGGSGGGGGSTFFPTNVLGTTTTNTTTDTTTNTDQQVLGEQRFADNSSDGQQVLGEQVTTTSAPSFPKTGFAPVNSTTNSLNNIYNYLMTGLVLMAAAWLAYNRRELSLLAK